jgi:hypothetical protein
MTSKSGREAYRAYKLRTFLLGLPQIEGRHTGENFAERVGEIINEFGFEDRIGYFVTDNADNNDTCLEDLGTSRPRPRSQSLRWHMPGPAWEAQA